MIEHNFKKKFGQNFLTDTNLLAAIVNDAGIEKGDEVLEIGAGAGALTSQLDKVAKKVVSYEIDNDLKDGLLALGLKNTTFVFADALKEDIEKIESHFDGKYKLVANLPYYITSPLIFKFLEDAKKIESMTIMVQKEVAERIVASPGTKDYGVLTVMVNMYGKPQIKRNLSRKLFYPVPNVDSSLVRIDICPKEGVDKKEFLQFIKQCFSMRRKTLVNCLEGYKGLSKSDLNNALGGFDLSRRSETFTIPEFIEMFSVLKKDKKVKNIT